MAVVLVLSAAPAVAQWNGQPRGYLQGNRFVVGDDDGGWTNSYRQSMLAMADRGIRPVLTGNAYSAATQWAMVPGACATPTASLGFHGLDAAHGWTPAAREQHLRRYPAALQAWLRATGILEQPWHVSRAIRPPELYQFMPPCDSVRRAVELQQSLPAFAPQKFPGQR